jgi:hypothetical protein
LIFFCQSQLAGSNRANLGNLIRCAHSFGAACGTLSCSTRLWLVSLQPRSALLLLKSNRP